ncbi:MAG: HAMP domain-containing histidine kinase [bacterium]|nr:HAMP domain-containing histidine kinase [bacterium]
MINWMSWVLWQIVSERNCKNNSLPPEVTKVMFLKKFFSKKGIKRYAYHIVFIMSLIMLTALVAWWAVFLHNSIEESYMLRYEGLIQKAQFHAVSLGHSKSPPPGIGILSRDIRLEIVAKKDAGPHSRQLIPFWKNLYVQPAAAYLEKIAKKRKSRIFMIYGESSLMVLLILISGLMIYRMYLLEHRTTTELHQFWNRISHEMKTPITGLKAFLETIRDQDLEREEMLPLVDLALQQVMRQQQLAENMLVGQKLRKKGLNIQVTPIALCSFVRSYVEHHSIGLSGSNVTLTLPESGDIIAKGDNEAIRVIFDNIVDNAVKYGGSDIKLSIIVETTGKKVLVRFKDNGPGFCPHMKKIIFDAYKRLKDELPGETHGTGMGLHISKQLARKMGGDLIADSNGKETGAEFILSLALKRRKKNE